MENNNRYSEVLKELEQETEKVKRSSHPSRIRINKEEQAEQRRKEKQEKHYANDALSFGDLYRLSSSGFSYPSALWAPLAFGLAAPGTYYGFDLDSTALSNYITPPYSDFMVMYAIAVAAQYLLLLPGPLLRASKLSAKLLQLSFKVTGGGRLIHRCDNDPLRFAACSVKIVTVKDIDPETASSLQRSAVELLFAEVNRTLSRIARTPDAYNNLKWTMNGTTARGYANNKVAGNLLKLITGRIDALQERTPFIKEIIIEVEDHTTDLDTD